MFRALHYGHHEGLRSSLLWNRFYSFESRFGKLHYTFSDLYCIISVMFILSLHFLDMWCFVGDFHEMHALCKTGSSMFFHDLLCAPDVNVCIRCFLMEPKQSLLLPTFSFVSLWQDCTGLVMHWLTEYWMDISAYFKHATFSIICMQHDNAIFFAFSFCLIDITGVQNV